jgi:hypothetical protein
MTREVAVRRDSRIRGTRYSQLRNLLAATCLVFVFGGCTQIECHTDKGSKTTTTQRPFHR